MAWLVAHKDGNVGIFDRKPRRTQYGYWTDQNEDLEDSEIGLSKGIVKILIGRELTWKDEPVELKEE